MPEKVLHFGQIGKFVGQAETVPHPEVIRRQHVLRVHPDVAVQRKAGIEPESMIRPRAEEIWQIDWNRTPAVVVDAGAPRDDVLSEIKSVIWSRL